MSKVYESDVDPDEFIRSFREESSGLPKNPKKKNMEREIKTPADDGNEPPQKSVAGSVPDDEEYYLDRFVRNMQHMRPLDKYSMVEINPKYVRKIKRILSYETGQVCSLKAYVNNVLSEHFQQYDKFIKKRL